MALKIERGVTLMLLASLSFAFMGGFVKLLTTSMPPLEITFFRNSIGVVLIGVTLFNNPLKQIGGKPLLLLFRGMIGFLSLLAYFYIIAFIPLGEAVTYNKLSPIFVALFAYIFLGEKLSLWALVGVVLGFVGIVLIAKPDGIAFDLYSLLGIFSGIGAALAYTSIRELRNYYDTRAIVLSFMVTGSVVPLVLMLLTPCVPNPKLEIFFSSFVMPSSTDWFYILGMGLFATLSQLLMTKAYELSYAAIVGTISYTNIIFAMIIGIMLGDSFPDNWTLLGVVLVIFSGILVLYRKTK
ncbi:MAG: membrane protein [Sulfurovum sp. FS08-3]|nr:MAG: membrane protein [Sulfurovum sp. FS08-3]